MKPKESLDANLKMIEDCKALVAAIEGGQEVAAALVYFNLEGHNESDLESLAHNTVSVSVLSNATCHVCSRRVLAQVFLEQAKTLTDEASALELRKLFKSLFGAESAHDNPS